MTFILQLNTMIEWLYLLKWEVKVALIKKAYTKNIQVGYDLMLKRNQTVMSCHNDNRYDTINDLKV